MKWKLLNSKLLSLLLTLSGLSASFMAHAGEPTAADSASIMRYEQRLQTRMDRWHRLIPNLLSVQFAGGTGMFSAGIGWDYGKNNCWETHLLFGFLPRQNHSQAYLTMTLNEKYLPWRIAVGKLPIEINPLVVSASIDSVLHEDFWTSEPDRYPKGYYGFSSRIRFQLGIGQRFSFNIPRQRRYLSRRLSAYYEVSTCDLYVRQKILNKHLPLKDIITIGIGIMYTI